MGWSFSLKRKQSAIKDVRKSNDKKKHSTFGNFNLSHPQPAKIIVSYGRVRAQSNSDSR